MWKSHRNPPSLFYSAYCSLLSFTLRCIWACVTCVTLDTAAQFSFLFSFLFGKTLRLRLALQLRCPNTL